MDSNRTYQTMNGLRGLAALAVLTRHLQPAILADQPLFSSYLAVDLFFMLSGFVLSFAYGGRLAEGMGVWEFMRRRLERLYPLYLLAATLGIAMAVRQGVSVKHLGLLFANAIYVPVPIGDLFHVYPLNFPAWSLGLELLVNLVLVIIFSQLSLPILIGSIAISSIALLATSFHFGDLNVGMHWKDAWGGLPRVMFSFFVGVAIERHQSKGPERLPAWTAYGLLTAMLVIFCVNAGEHQAVYDFVIVAGVFPLMVFLSARCEPVGIGAQAMTIAGVASYAIYVLQDPVIQIASKVVLKLGWSATPWLATVFIALFFASCLLIDAVYDVPVRRMLASRRRA